MTSFDTYTIPYLTTAPQLLNMSAAYAGETQAYTDNINSFVVNRKPPPLLVRSPSFWEPSGNRQAHSSLLTRVLVGV